MRRAHCGAWLEVACPALVQRLGGELEPFCRLCGDSRWGWGVISWIWPLAGIAVKAVSTSELRSSRAQLCVRVHTDKGEKKLTRTRKWHLNYGGMLYKISSTFWGNLLLLQSLFSPLTPGVPQSHAAFWLLPEQHKRGRLTCLPTRV